MELRLVFGAAQLPIPTEQVLFQYHPKFRIRFACSIYYSNHATGLDCTGRAVVRPFIIVHVRVALCLCLCHTISTFSFRLQYTPPITISPRSVTIVQWAAARKGGWG